MLAHKRVLELGAGTGAVGLALALSTGDLASLLLTDLEAVVPLTADNVRFAASRHAKLRDLAARGALNAQAYCWYTQTLELPLASNRRAAERSCAAGATLSQP